MRVFVSGIGEWGKDNNTYGAPFYFAILSGVKFPEIPCLIKLRTS